MNAMYMYTYNHLKNVQNMIKPIMCLLRTIPNHSLLQYKIMNIIIYSPGLLNCFLFSRMHA